MRGLEGACRALPPGFPLGSGLRGVGPCRSLPLSAISCAWWCLVAGRAAVGSGRWGASRAERAWEPCAPVASRRGAEGLRRRVRSWVVVRGGAEVGVPSLRHDTLQMPRAAQPGSELMRRRTRRSLVLAAPREYPITDKGGEENPRAWSHPSREYQSPVDGEQDRRTRERSEPNQACAEGAPLTFSKASERSEVPIPIPHAAGRGIRLGRGAASAVRDPSPSVAIGLTVRQQATGGASSARERWGGSPRAGPSIIRSFNYSNPQNPRESWHMRGVVWVA